MKLYGQTPHSGDIVELPDGSSAICLASSFDKNNSKQPEVQELPNGMIKAKLDNLFDYYRACVPEDVFFRNTDNKGYVILSKFEYDKMCNDYKERKLKEISMQKCVMLNNKGIELEKLGEIDAAISIYEQNIDGNCYPAFHSFDRLLVLYRKSKMYENEKRVCVKAIEVLKHPKYNQRLDKINALIDKSK